MTTLRKMEERGFRATRRLEHGSESYIHDATSPYYSWLLPGWLAEERVVESGRTYRVCMLFFGSSIHLHYLIKCINELVQFKTSSYLFIH